jgi:hypothetical protein
MIVDVPKAIVIASEPKATAEEHVLKMPVTEEPVPVSLELVK